MHTAMLNGGLTLCFSVYQQISVVMNVSEHFSTCSCRVWREMVRVKYTARRVIPAPSGSPPVTDPVPMALDPAPVAAPPAVPCDLPSDSGRQVRVTCMLDACQLTFSRVSSMKRHALQFHGLRENSTPATAEEVAKAKDNAKKCTRPKETAPPPLGHAAKVPRLCRSVETHLRLMNEDDLLAECNSPDVPDSPPPSPAVTATNGRGDS